MRMSPAGRMSLTPTLLNRAANIPHYQCSLHTVPYNLRCRAGIVHESPGASHILLLSPVP